MFYKQGRALCLTAEGETFLRATYPFTDNVSVIRTLGVGMWVLRKFVKELGLKKDPEYLRKMNHDVKVAQWQNFSEQMRAEVISKHMAALRKNWRPKPKGVSNVEWFGEEVEQRRKEKSKAGVQRTHARERARLTFGLEPKCKFRHRPRFVSEKVWYQIRGLRWYMRSRYKYRAEVGQMSVFVTEDTTRRPKLEQRLVALGGTVFTD